jgi:hypothetical protein
MKMDGSSVYHDSTDKSIQEQIFDLGVVVENAASDGSQNEAPEGATDQAGTVPCDLCNRPVRTDDPTVYREVRVWISGEKRNLSALRHYTGQYAHRDCITKVRNGLAPDEVSIFDDQEPVVGTDDSETEAIGVSDDWRAGYTDGRAGLVPALASPDGPRNNDYWRGHTVGKADRELGNDMFACAGQKDYFKNRKQPDA